MGHFDLWFARILRLTGTAMLLGFVLALILTAVLSLDTNPAPETTRLFGLSIIVGIGMLFVGIPLVLVGDKVSPPDPWLDPWLNPFKGRRPVHMNQDKEKAEETEQ